MYRYFRSCYRLQLGNRFCSGSAAPTTQSQPTVEGLSKKVFSIPPNPVGPGASKSSDYKNPEYFSYDKMSYFEAEIEMLKYRLPQPSSHRK